MNKVLVCQLTTHKQALGITGPPQKDIARLSNKQSDLLITTAKTLKSTLKKVSVSQKNQEKTVQSKTAKSCKLFLSLHLTIYKYH